MSIIQVAEKHVLNPVRGVENTDANPLPSLVQCAEKHAFPFLVDQIALFQKRVFVDHTFVQCPRVFCQAERRIFSQELCQVHRVDRRMGDR